MFELVPASIAAGLPSLTPALAIVLVQSLAHLSLLDLAVIAIYFVMVIWIGFYLKGQANTSEEFFMAGREMTAWIAGLSFVSANLGSLELMGWAGSSYQYGILAAHWYWIGAIPAMLFLYTHHPISPCKQPRAFIPAWVTFAFWCTWGCYIFSSAKKRQIGYSVPR